MTVAPYGSWPSPITAEVLLADTVSLGQVRVDGGDVWWSEGRPSEGGRVAVMRLAGGRGEPADALAEPWSARTRVHEYGGGSYALYGGTMFFANQPDQRIWRLDEGPGDEPVPLTPEPPEPASLRYADGDASPDGRWIALVRERHRGPGAADVDNDLVAVSTDPHHTLDPAVLAAGHDFYAAPRWSPDGRRLAWIQWDHPNMPWDGTELWVADVAADRGGRPLLAGERRVAGGPQESVLQPAWSPDGVLHWASDASGWWNLYAERAGGAGGARSLAALEAEMCVPQWVFGQSSYTFLAGGRLVATWLSGGIAHLGVVADGRVREIPTPFNEISSLAPLGDNEVVAVAASATVARAVVAIDVDTGNHRVLRHSSPEPLAAGAISAGDSFEFETAGGATAHALLYRPRLEGYEGPAGERPPLIVTGHGGPTGATSPGLRPSIQFWTSRGFAVADVDYRGSTGYGRAYRRLLDGQWGVVDVEDCVNVARHLAAAGEVDPARMVIKGGSASGLTVYAALAHHDVFAAGASYYGVADMETLVAETHKFESRYLDRLVGPLPEAAHLYRERSPVHAADRITAPLILFQGLEDKVVPPSQSEAVVAALRRQGVPHAYVTFEGEPHRFRQAASQKRSIEAELWFYGQVLGFTPADDIEPVHIAKGP